MKIIVSIFLLTFCFVNYAQKTYFVKDKEDLSAIPFAKIYPEKVHPFLSDIDGKFTVPEGETKLVIKAASYKDSIVDLTKVLDSVIFLQAQAQHIQEIKVLAGENPAHRIINQVIANKKLNNPIENDPFTYEAYSKFVFSFENENLANKVPTDSSEIKLRKLMDEQHLFLLESASKRTFIPPSRDKDEIIAYKVSGFSDPMFSTFAQEMQSFSFYENRIELLGKTYINPIAFGATNRYFFLLQDTTIQGMDTTFTIFYRPYKGKSFDGLTGQLFVNTKGYAIEKVIAAPYFDTTGLSLKIIQEYQFTNEKKWFPAKLSTEMSVPFIETNIKGTKVVGKGNTYIQNVRFEKDEKPFGYFNNVTVDVLPDANQKEEKDWNNIRNYQLTEKEQKTYKVIDSLSKAMNFDKKLKALRVLTEGKVPLGPIQLDLNRLIDYNNFEGYRFGLGLETSEKLMKFAQVGGYFAWATKDKQWKYGGFSKFYLNRRNGIELLLNYQKDVYELGFDQQQSNGFKIKDPEQLRRYFRTNFDYVQAGDLALSGYIKANIQLKFGFSVQQFKNVGDYLILNHDFFQPSSKLHMNSSINFELNWNIREKVMLIGNQRVSLPSNYPKINVKVSKGLKNVFDSEFDYWRVSARISQKIPLLNVGNFNWCLQGGITDGYAPIAMMHSFAATGLPWTISVDQSFETMTPGIFYHRAQAALFTEFAIRKIKTKDKWNEPQFSLHHAIGFGTFTDHNMHLPYAYMPIANKGYTEFGIKANNLLVSSFMGMGIGCFYRYGNFASKDWKMNIFPKITFSFQF